MFQAKGLLAFPMPRPQPRRLGSRMPAELQLTTKRQTIPVKKPRMAHIGMRHRRQTLVSQGCPMRSKALL